MLYSKILLENIINLLDDEAEISKHWLDVIPLIIERRRMKKRIRPVRSLSSQILWLFLNLTTLAFDLGFGSIIWSNILSGRTYSPAVMLGFGTFLYKSVSPVGYWICIGLYIFCFLIGIAIAMQQFFEILAEEKRRVASKNINQSSEG